MEMSSKLFGTSGIRGLVNVELTPSLAMRVGAALASQFSGGVIAVGRDTRTSGEMLESAIASGIVSCGIDVKTVGVVPTPVLAYLTRELGADAGVAISASHNPPQYNGIKVFDSTGMAYTEERQQLLEESVERGDFKLPAWDAIGNIEAVDARQTYINGLSGRIRLERRWRVACDLFNGATSAIAPAMFRRMDCRATLIDAQPDGRFPAGDPEPTQGSLQRLGRVVVESGSEIGFGFDGDGDRMMAVDERGEIPTPDRVMAAYAGHVVAGNGGGVIVTHVGASMCIDEAVERAGGSVVRTKVGDVSIAEAIKGHAAVFGGEPVGAWIHPDVHPCPDGILSALRLMRALEEKGETLTEFIGQVPDYPIVNVKVDCPNDRKAAVMDSIRRSYEEFIDDVISVSTVDGIRLDLGRGWILLRPSGTEPVIRITAEAKDAGAARELVERGRRLVAKSLGGS
jgi:phosphoglucosamine mutase